MRIDNIILMRWRTSCTFSRVFSHLSFYFSFTLHPIALIRSLSLSLVRPLSLVLSHSRALTLALADLHIQLSISICVSMQFSCPWPGFVYRNQHGCHAIHYNKLKRNAKDIFAKFPQNGNGFIF